MVAMAMTVPLVMGTLSTVSAVETKKQVKVEAYSPQKKAIEYLKGNANQYGLKPDLSDLQYISTTETPVASYVRFQQVVNGAPVFSNQITVTLNGEGKGVLAVSDYQPIKAVKQVTEKLVKRCNTKSMAYVGEASEQTYGLLQRKNLDTLLKRELLVQYIKWLSILIIHLVHGKHLLMRKMES